MLGKSPQDWEATLVLVGKWAERPSLPLHVPCSCLLPWPSLPLPKPGPQQRATPPHPLGLA